MDFYEFWACFTGAYGSLCFRKRSGKWTLKAQVCRNRKVVENGEKFVAGAIKACARRCTHTKREYLRNKKGIARYAISVANYGLSKLMLC